MESKIDYGHSLLQSRPNFAKALKDFETFLTATQDDLQRKFRILNEQRSNRKTSRNVKTYLTLQNFLLQKHVHRLNEFQTEILRRVSLIFANSDTTQTDGDQQFMQILADMSKMKTRCKHILDVTDRYCVLTEVNTGQVHHMFFTIPESSILFHEIICYVALFFFLTLVPLPKKWYFVTKIVLTYCEKKLF